jgi:hypothetical protein
MTDLSNSDENDEINHRTINYFETKINLTDKNKINLDENKNNENNLNNDFYSKPIEINEDTEIIENNSNDNNNNKNKNNLNKNEDENDFSKTIRLEIKNVLNDHFIEEPRTGITARKIKINKNNNYNFNYNNNVNNIIYTDNSIINNNDDEYYNNNNNNNNNIKNNNNNIINDNINENNNLNNNDNNIKNDDDNIKKKNNNNNNNYKNILDENFSGNENFIHCRNCLKFFSYYLSKNIINNNILI